MRSSSAAAMSVVARHARRRTATATASATASSLAAAGRSKPLATAASYFMDAPPSGAASRRRFSNRPHHGLHLSCSDSTFAVPNHPTLRRRCKSSVAAALDSDDDDLPTSTSSTAGKHVIPFPLADIGEGITEVELLQWYVSPGDAVQQFDRIAEVQSDKATVEITSRYDGVVESLGGSVGDMIKVGEPLMHIATESSSDVGGKVAAAEPMTTEGEAADGGGIGEAATSEGAGGKTLHNVDDVEDRLHIPRVPSIFPEVDAVGPRSTSSSATKVLATPAVRRLGMEHDLDLRHIVGTGPKGRILKADVLKYIQDQEGGAGVDFHQARLDELRGIDKEGDGKKGAGVASPPAAAAVGTPFLSGGAQPQPTEDTIVPLRGYARQMVKSMTASLSVPHMCYGDEINVSHLKRVRDELRPLVAAASNTNEDGGGVIKLSYLPFLIKATSLALTEYPVLNSRLDVERMEVTYLVNHDIGVAMDTPRGLAVPVVRQCQNLSVLEIAKELNRLQGLAAEGSLPESDITGATFSLSNIGTIGGTYMVPVVAPPQVAIGAVGRIQRLPRFVSDDSDEVEAVEIMQVSWGADHRIVDGATLARFSNRWKAYLESPASMVLVMK